jgi:hypothetical protein
MSTTSQLTHWMRHDPTFIGVFPLDEIPHLPPTATSHSFIVNNQTRNLAGQHWMAVRVVQSQAWIFDPLSILPPPPLLSHHLLQHCHVHTLHVCDIQVQPLSTTSCGHHCVYFLYTGLPAVSETHVMDFVKQL